MPDQVDSMPEMVIPEHAVWAAAVMGNFMPNAAGSGIQYRNQTFMVTDQHLRLLKAAKVAWSSQWDGGLFGAPTIDPRRPYGGNKDQMKEMVRILGMKIADVGSRKWDPELDEVPDYVCNSLEALHQETEIVLKIILNTGKVETGKYYWPPEEGDDWVKVKEKADA